MSLFTYSQEEVVPEVVSALDDGPPTYTCDELAAEAVTGSQERALITGADYLLSVRELSLVHDAQGSYAIPETGDLVLLRCSGTGVWGNGTTIPIDVWLTIDSESAWFYWWGDYETTRVEPGD